MTLLDMVKRYQELLLEKDRLADLAKENSSEIEKQKAAIAQQMLDDDCPQIACGDYTYSLSAKTAYSKRSEAELAASGTDFLMTLREEGLGDLIVETVNPRTLQSAMKAYVEENGELSEGLQGVIKSYDFNDITRRRIAARKRG